MTRLTVCALLAALLAGCEMDGLVAVTVDGDGGGTLAVTLAVDEELRQAAGDAGADPLAGLVEAGEGLAGWRVARSEGGGSQDRGAGGSEDGSAGGAGGSERGSGRGAGGEAVTLSTRFRDSAELERITRGFAEGLAGPELAPLGPMRVTVTEDTVELAGTADLRVSAAVRELGLSRRRARARLSESLRFRVTARMPGTILRTNADEQRDDNTVVWNIAPGEHRALRVAAERPWILARITRLLVDPYGVAATFIGAALILAWHRYTATTQPPYHHPDVDQPPRRSTTTLRRQVRGG
jgi:hypothetical protein